MAHPVSYKLADGIATINMDDGKANALSLAMLTAVNEALDQALEEDVYKRQAMTNVAITVEEQAQGRDLFGLYVGVPLTRRYYGTWYANPDQIFIYRRTICEHCRTKEDVRNLVHTTVVHEIAHHFGISDPRLHELGWG